jgi:TonB family protein
MSSAPLDRNQQSKSENRRVHVRRRIEQLTYAKFGPDNGGILINLSEGGLSFQGVGVVGRDELLHVNFTLPGMPPQIEATGQVVWSNDSGKGGGLRFLDLNEETRNRIKEWIARNGSPEGIPAAEVTINRDTGSAGASDETFVQSLPVLEKKQPSNSPAPKPRSRPIETWQTSSSASRAANTSNIAAETPLRAPRVLPEFREPPQAPSTSKPQFVAFATGVMAGCVVVLAAIAGVRMLGPSNRPTNTVEAQPPAEQRVAEPVNENPPVGGTGLNDRPLILNNKTVATVPTSNQGFVSKTPVRKNEVVTRSESSVGSREDSQKKNLTDLTLLTPRVPNRVAPAEVRQPSIGENAPSALSSMDETRAGSLNMPDPRKPPQPLPEKSERTVNFMEPVLIAHSAPAYPPSAKANHIEGTVKLSAIIGTDGVPRALKLVSGDLTLARAAEDAVSKWRYVPAVFRGAPVDSNIIISIKFELKQ